MKKLRWLKEWQDRKIGDISNAGAKSAENFVSQGFAEYVEEPEKPKHETSEIAFKTFPEKIFPLEKDEDKHRAWLKTYYQGLHFSIGQDKQDLILWKQEQDKYIYSDDLWKSWFCKDFEGNFLYASNINKIQRNKRILTIEFDGDNAKESLEKTYKKLKKLGYGFIRSSHNGKCDYLWIRFTRELSSEEAKAFLVWISPEGSEVDLNFTNDNFRLPVLFAEHWKYGTRELPIEYFQGKMIDFDSLGIEKRKINAKSFKGYQTFEKSEEKEITDIIGDYVNKIDLAKKFIALIPIYYDEKGLWWKWNPTEYKYELVDDVDLLNNLLKKSLFLNIINSRERTEILNSLKQVARENKPKDMLKTWVQFKNRIIDFKTGEEFEATSDYFLTNPIPWEIGKTEETPEIDKLFKAWVIGDDQDKSYVQTLYEIISYICSYEQFMQTIIALIGSGANGKGTFRTIVEKFIGKENSCTTNLKRLCSGHFETSALYKKLLCVIPEVDYDDLSDTNMIKSISGEDPIRYEFKGKTPFTSYSPTTILILTNCLPITKDKQMGFYRRWLLIDFPNQFEKKSGIINTIPDIEYNNLALKVIRILKELYKNNKFTNEGNYQQKETRYEEKSNPIQKFIDLHYEDCADNFVILRQFAIDFNQYLKQKHLRPMSVIQVGKVLKDLGLDIGVRKTFEVSYKCILNFRKK